MTDAAESSDLVLASSSPRRRQLLLDAGLAPRVVDPPVPEPGRLPQGLTPCQQAEALAFFKAKAVRDTVDEPFVLGADTIVVLGQQILGKPADQAEARRMLAGLSGSRHQVITGVALLGRDGARLIASEVTYVTMRGMTPEELDAYIASGEWIGKAGAYAIQETADRFVDSVEGSFSNVVGLPLELVRRMIRELRDHPEAHRPRRAEEP